MPVSLQPSLYPTLSTMEETPFTTIPKNEVTAIPDTKVTTIPDTHFTTLSGPEKHQGIVPIQYRKLTSEDHEKTKELVTLATEIANTVLNPKTTVSQAESNIQTTVQTPQTSYGTSTSHISDSYNVHAPTYSFFSPVSHTHQHHHYTQIDTRTEEERKSDSDKNKQFWAILAGTVITLVGSYLFGKYLAQGETSGDERAPFDRLVKKWEESRPLYSERYQENVDTIVEKTGKILDRKQSDHFYKVVFAVAALATGVLLLVGGIVGSPLLMGTGLLLGIGTGAGALFHWAYRSNSEMNSRDAKAILESKAKLASIPEIGRNPLGLVGEIVNSTQANVETSTQYERIYPTL